MPQSLPVLAMGAVLGPPPVHYGAMSPGEPGAPTEERARAGACSIVPPPGWGDASHVTFLSADAAIAITREPGAGELAAAVERRLAWLREPGLEILASRRARVVAREAHVLHVRFASAPAEQRVLLIAPGPGERILVVSSTAPSASFLAASRALDTLVDGLELDDRLGADPSRQRLGAVSFTSPPGFEPTTTLFFTAPAHRGAIVVTTERVVATELFEATVARKLSALAAQTPGFTLHERAEHAPLGGRRASLLRFSRTGNANERIEHVLLLVEPCADGTMTVLASMDVPREDASFTALVESARFENDGGMAWQQRR